ncbi:hypothetical protein FRB96_004451 [Tulasnella sp. 330]|nr:hypothetical protein FRB96_004451 [Tulasnella sp. 330]KAG8880547.1 hypothetical protein FRB97_000717 [Tulasnella sp. 331]KAG8887215.1 hypothetical protein FRB98_000377 [Tulasnella sp. 332]
MTISQDPSAPLIAVVGATGMQGGSVIKRLAESPKPYRIKGFTRDPSKPAAKALAEQKVEIVVVSLTVDNKDAVYKAFQGADIAFTVTNFWEHMDKARETAEGKLLIDAATAAGVKLLIWSGLVSAAEVSHGKYMHADHLDSKAEVTKYGRHTTSTSPTRFVNVIAGLYDSNFISPLFSPKKQEDGSFALVMPVSADCIVPSLDTARDYGLFVRKVIEDPSLANAKDVGAYGEFISYAQMVKEWSEITGKDMRYLEVTKEQYIAGGVASGLPERIALELYEMFAVIAEEGYFSGLDIGRSRLPEGLEGMAFTWAEFVKSMDWSELLK